jgi:hypothetical protein
MLGTRKKSVVNFTPGPLYSLGGNPLYPLNRRLVGSHSQSDVFEDTIFCTSYLKIDFFITNLCCKSLCFTLCKGSSISATAGTDFLVVKSQWLLPNFRDILKMMQFHSGKHNEITWGQIRRVWRVGDNSHAFSSQRLLLLLLFSEQPRHKLHGDFPHT